MDSPTKTISNKILLGQTRFSNTDSFSFFPNQSSVFLPSTSSRTRKYIHPCPFIHSINQFIHSHYIASYLGSMFRCFTRPFWLPVPFLQLQQQAWVLQTIPPTWAKCKVGPQICKSPLPHWTMDARATRHHRI